MFKEIRKRVGSTTSHERAIEEKQKLDIVWSKQVNKLIELGFNTYLGMSPEDYKKSFVKFSNIPDEYKYPFKKLNVPLLVDPRVPLEKQLKMAGIDYDAKDVEKVFDLKPSPQKPYNIWTHDSVRHWSLTGKNDLLSVVERKPEDEVFCNLNEIVSLFIQYPEFFQRDKVDALGSRIIIGKSLRVIPSINDSNPPRLRLNIADPRTVMQTRGEQISIAY